MGKRVFGVGGVFLALIICFSVSACVHYVGVDGKSAYDVACDNGFTGTEQEWLDSLVGKDGEDGTNGKNGKDAPEQEGIDIYDLFDAYLLENPDATFAEFLQEYMVVGYHDTEYAVGKGIRSAVSVYSRFTKGMPEQEYSSGGAGVVYKIDGDDVYIITNYHVVYDRDSAQTDKIAYAIEVYTYGFERAEHKVEAEFIGGSVSKDIAVIKVSRNDFSDDIEVAQIADSNDITLGERVVALGNPLGEGIAATTGVISVDSENIEMEALDSASDSIVLRVMRTDTPINGGNSGGGLFNARGELVGIVNAKTVKSGVESMGYAIPVNVAAGIADCVIENEGKKCVLGITVTASTSSTQYNPAKNKVEIIEKITVLEIGAGLAQGRLQVGDELVSVSINDQEEELQLTRIFQLPDYLHRVRKGDTVNLEIIRGGETMTVALSPQDGNFASV